MELKYLSLSDEVSKAKFDKKGGEDSGISDQASTSSKIIKSDSLRLVNKTDKDIEFKSNKDTIDLFTKPIHISRFMIYEVRANDSNLSSKSLYVPPIRYEIRNPYPDEITEICHWRHKELGFRAHLDYLRSLYNCYPSGWIVAIDKKGEIIGTIFAMNMNEDQAFGGLFAVKKAYRCQGIGGQLWKVRLNYIGNRNLGINALESRIAPNEKLGMKVAFRMSRYYGRLTIRVINSFKLKFRAPVSNNYTFRKLSNIQESLPTSMNQKELLQSIIEYDTQINTIPRAQFLEEAINHFEHTITIACIEETIMAIDKDNDIIK
ncbi:unnamed protein product [Gordionus sp. m RMFG-2023]